MWPLENKARQSKDSTPSCRNCIIFGKSRKKPLLSTALQQLELSTPLLWAAVNKTREVSLVLRKNIQEKMSIMVGRIAVNTWLTELQITLQKICCIYMFSCGI